MPSRIAITNLQASTMDILNVIRQNASLEYQNLVPTVETANDIPRVGEALFGYPALANQFLASLMNRIALVRVKSATFNNKFAKFKKGYLEFGELVEEIFVELAKVQRFDPEKASAREFKRTVPNVRNAFHAMNWRVQYPVTISHQELRTAFTSESGVRNLVESILQQVYTASEYDEFLLTKYLIIKAVAHGKMTPISIGNGDMTLAAETYRGTSDLLEFLSSDYNAAGVYNATPKSRQHILMDAKYKAKYDVEVLANAFNMDKTDLIGKLTTIDSFTTFDNERWAAIRAECDGIEEVTAEELSLMEGVKAILLDEDWFQIYDNLMQMTETFVGSGMYWNYWLNTFKTISSSPFANAVVFALSDSIQEKPNKLKFKIASWVDSDNTTTMAVVPVIDAGIANNNCVHIQTAEATEAGIAVHPYGVYIVPEAIKTTEYSMTMSVDVGGTTYSAKVNPAYYRQGVQFELNKV